MSTARGFESQYSGVGGPSVEELLLELNTARDDLTHALSEIEDLHHETEDHCHTIDILQKRCHELEDELEEKKKELAIRAKLTYKETKGAAGRRATRNNMLNELESYDTNEENTTDEGERWEDWKGMVDDKDEPPIDYIDQSQNSRHLSQQQTPKGNRFRNIFGKRKDNNQHVHEVAMNNDSSVQYFSDPEYLSNRNTKANESSSWLKGNSNFNTTNRRRSNERQRGRDFSEHEADLLRQLHVLQAEKNRQVQELELKLQQRETAISTLENALLVKDDTMKLMQEEFDAELGGGKRGIFGRGRSKSRGRMMRRPSGANSDYGGDDDRSVFSVKSTKDQSKKDKRSKKKKPKRSLLGNHVQADFDIDELLGL